MEILIQCRHRLLQCFDLSGSILDHGLPLNLVLVGLFRRIGGCSWCRRCAWAAYGNKTLKGLGQGAQRALLGLFVVHAEIRFRKVRDQDLQFSAATSHQVGEGAVVKAAHLQRLLDALKLLHVVSDTEIISCQLLEFVFILVRRQRVLLDAHKEQVVTSSKDLQEVKETDPGTAFSLGAHTGHEKSGRECKCNHDSARRAYRHPK